MKPTKVKKEDTKQGKTFTEEELRESIKTIEAQLVQYQQMAIKAQGFLEVMNQLLDEKKEDE